MGLWKRNNKSLEDSGKLKFPLELGNIGTTAYRIYYETVIEYGAEYQKEIKFDNKAI